MKKSFSIYYFFIFIFIFSCKPKQNVIYMENKNDYEEKISEAKFVGLHIQEGDKLQILVSAFDDIAVQPFNINTMQNTGSDSKTSAAPSEYIVSSDGTINFPVLGNIFCKGMTKKQLKEDLENKLLRYLTDPLVTINLINFNFFVLGEVSSSGQKTSATEKLNIFQAIAIAGDVKEGGDKTRVKLIRHAEDTGKDQIILLDLTDAAIVNSPYYYVQQNDIIYVEPDKNQRIAMNNNASVEKWIKYGGVALGLLSLILTLTRLK